MKAKLKSIFSWDIPGDLETWMPTEGYFGISIMLFIGTEDDNKSDCFDLFLCMPNWFASKMEERGIASGQWIVFVNVLIMSNSGLLLIPISSDARVIHGRKWQRNSITSHHGNFELLILMYQIGK
jgi:hypothetical protein